MHNVLLIEDNRCPTASAWDEGVLDQAIISLGHNLHLHVVAEGVETDAQVRFLKRHRCDEVQGFFYGEPMEPAAHARLLSRAG
jgi:EAL domain-containing protein (putative c-di-GMP-specific phosphodiesterase class I)